MSPEWDEDGWDDDPCAIPPCSIPDPTDAFFCDNHLRYYGDLPDMTPRQLEPDWPFEEDDPWANGPYGDEW